MKSGQELQGIREISIQEFLALRGIPHNSPKGDKIFFKSPFTKDSNFSLCVYTSTNSFYDWSQGFGGSIIDLVMAMDGLTFHVAVEFLKAGKFSKYQLNYKQSKPIVQKQFEYTRYLTNDVLELSQISEYANSRGWRNGYESGAFHIIDDGKWRREPSVIFLHRDEDNVICGAKFRKVRNTLSDKDNGPRFSARGRMAFYILENYDTESFGSPTLYVVEGEGNANSLWQYCKETKRNCVIISFGGVGNLPKHLPNKYLDIKEKKLIIDYDGDEELYLKRVKLYEPYGLTPIRMALPKGEDINSLYLKKEMKLIDKLL